MHGMQGRGRARQADSSFVVLSERADRPAALLVKVSTNYIGLDYAGLAWGLSLTSMLNSARECLLCLCMQGGPCVC